MAAGTVLKMKYETTSGSITHTWKHSKPSPTLENIKNLGAQTIANGSVFMYRPLKLTDARIVTTTEQVYDLEQ